MFRFLFPKKQPPAECWDIEKGWDVQIIIHSDKHRSGSGVRTHECINTVELKSTPLDQLGHPAMMPAMLMS